jgi:hypothetical protein
VKMIASVHPAQNTALWVSALQKPVQPLQTVVKLIPVSVQFAQFALNLPIARLLVKFATMKLA